MKILQGGQGACVASAVEGVHFGGVFGDAEGAAGQCGGHAQTQSGAAGRGGPAQETGAGRQRRCLRGTTPAQPAPAAKGYNL